MECKQAGADVLPKNLTEQKKGKKDKSTLLGIITGAHWQPGIAALRAANTGRACMQHEAAASTFL